jgi:hypothetical protein
MNSPSPAIMPTDSERCGPSWKDCGPRTRREKRGRPCRASVSLPAKKAVDQDHRFLDLERGDDNGLDGGFFLSSCAWPASRTQPKA